MKIENAAVAAIRMLPPRRRFAAAMRISAWMGSLLDLLFRVLRKNPLRFCTARELCLSRLLDAMDRARLQFDVACDFRGLEWMRRTTAEGKGVLLIATHANAGLTRLMLPPVCDANVRIMIVSRAKGYPVCGRDEYLPTICPEGAFLLAVRRELRSGTVVAAMIDIFEPAAGAPVEIRNGSVWLADPIVRLAVRCGMPICFIKARIDGRRVVVDFDQVSGASDHGAVIRHFVQFVAPPPAAPPDSAILPPP